MSRRNFLAVSLAAVALCYLFWRPLWHGGGLVGGDTYSYYFPQKTFYADELRAGRLPLWNPLVGHGYPTAGESQTGVWYPPHLLLYRVLEVNTAYNATQLIHYVLAFVATWLFARRLGLGAWGAGLCGLVFVYGWFAPRLCLEWAILGGVYLPFLGWCAESYLQLRQTRYLLLISAALGLHLLAGHFNLAFIEVLAVALYSLLRATLQRQESTVRGTVAGAQSLVDAPNAAPMPGLPARAAPAVAIVAALIAGFGLAAVQLAPTWELKQRSQRAGAGAAHDPAYGHIPPWYMVQVLTPWMWYAPDVDADDALASIHTLTVPAATNKVEAHLYFGLVPLGLAVGGLAWRRSRGAALPRPLAIWCWLGVVAAVYATGWLVPLTRHLPGFGFFIGPGRYGIVTTLAVGLLAGDALDLWCARRRGIWRVLGLAAVLGLSLLDLWIVRCAWNRRADGAPNWYADLVADPPLKHRGESVVREVLSRWPQPVRMWGSFQNMPTITGFAMTPTYLGLSPEEYLDPPRMLPASRAAQLTSDETAAQVAWLRRAGVTHVLAEQPLDRSRWPVDPAWSGYDAFLHRAWARGEPLYLYTLRDSPGRVRVTPPDAGGAEVTAYAAHRVTVRADMTSEAEVVLTDLAYPGWTVSIDGVPADSLVADGMFRGVRVAAGRHEIEWRYNPQSIAWGRAVSAATLLVLAGAAWRARRRRNL